MEIREFAESVLLGETVSDKLSSDLIDLRFSDLRPVSVSMLPELPARGTRLEINWERHEEFPNRSKLIHATERAKVLHHFANHELLALELMALVLLKFPEAPAGFRLGLANIMREEQKHMGMYLNRMRQLGVEFGDFPLNGFFWRILSGVKTPSQFTALMSLTLEQANLDHCVFFEKLFSEVGDTTSASIMRDVFEDEIGHVRHGLKWFDKWRNPELSFWDGYVSELPQGFSVTRAKGRSFLEDVRRKIGFDENYIRKLAVHQQSKGRVPKVHWFYPFVEVELAHENDSGASNEISQPIPPRLLALASDLRTLPQFYCASDDVVLVDQKPRAEYLEILKGCGFFTPEFLTLDELAGRRVRGLSPWGWCSSSLHLYHKISCLPDVVVGASMALASPFYGKAFSVECLRKYLEGCFDGPEALRPMSAAKFSAMESVGRVCQSSQEILSAAQDYAGLGYSKVLIKENFGSSGRGHKSFTVFDDAFTKWLDKVPPKTFVIEPFFEKVLDFSFQFIRTDDGELRKLGLVRFLTDSFGHYKGAWLGKFHAGLSSEVLRFLNEENFLDNVFDGLHRLLKSKEEFLPEAVGVDAMVYRDNGGALKLRPIIEINPRFNMGTATSKISQRVAPRSVGFWLLLNKKDLKVNGQRRWNSFKELTDCLSQLLPLEVLNHGRPQVVQGIVPTNDPNSAQNYLGLLVVGKNPDDLLKLPLNFKFFVGH